MIALFKSFFWIILFNSLCLGILAKVRIDLTKYRIFRQIHSIRSSEDKKELSLNEAEIFIKQNGKDLSFIGVKREFLKRLR